MSARAAGWQPVVATRAIARPLASRAAALADAWSTWLALAGSFIVVAALYGRALSLGFFFDDTLDLARGEGRGYWQLLSSSKGYVYYRPLPFLIWKALRAAQGRYDPTTLHLLPLAAHALAGWLLYLLVRRLGAGQWALVPALLFLTYPFSYQDVAIAGTLFHPLVGAAVLTALTLYQRARSTTGSRRVGWHVAAMAATALALWTHESGVIVAPLVVGLELLLLWHARSRRPSPWVVAHLLLTALFVVTWFSVAKAPSDQHPASADLRPKALFFLQGFVYPGSAQLNWLREWTPWSAGILDVGAVALTLAVGAYALSAWRCRRWTRLAIPSTGLVVALAASAPSMARLTWAYVEDAPRLLYLVGAGAAIFWGLLPMLDFPRRWLTLAWRVVTLALLGAVVAQSWRFVDLRMTMFADGAQAVDGVVAAGETYQGQRLLIVNAPSWLAQNAYEYPYGHFGVQLAPSYIGLDRVIYTSSERASHVDAVSVAYQPEVDGRFTLGPHGAAVDLKQIDAYLREGSELIVVARDGDGFTVRDAGRLAPGQAERRDNAPARLGDGVWLSNARGVLTRDGLTLYVTWNVLAPTGVDVETVVELRDASGQRVAGYTGFALSGLSAPALWQTGDRVDDTIRLATPPSGTYTVWAGLQRVNSTERLPALDAGGARPDGMARVGQIVVP